MSGDADHAGAPATTRPGEPAGRTEPPGILSDPATIVTAFARVLRAAGLDVPVGSVITFGEALAEVGAERREGVYWAGRSTLVRKPEDVPVYDHAFAAFWDQRPGALTARQDETLHVTIAVDDDEGGTEGDDADDATHDPDVTVRFSRHEILRHKDFAAYTASELDEARRLMADLRLAGTLRRCRRLVPAKGPTSRPDLRRTVRHALRAGGEPIERRFRVQADRPRRLVLLCDVSGSMEPYARALVRFLHAAVVGRTKVEAFALGTRLTRVTRELSSRDPDEAVARAARRVVDWSGGTRLGEGLKTFNDEWGVRGMARGAIVVILSDGWDRGEPELMAEQMARLHRVARLVVWVNPLKATPGYLPLARGMAAALPYVDEFVEGHSLAALEHLARVISQERR
jgi:uncharacterized protein with von Willebrand factor type A (vWA) domain